MNTEHDASREFDATEHRFGMAYTSSREGHKYVFYPTYMEISGALGGTAECIKINGKRHDRQWCREMRRSPEHDLVTLSNLKGTE